MDGAEVTYFCSNLRLDTILDILSENNIKVNEVEAYETKLDAKKVEGDLEELRKRNQTVNKELEESRRTIAFLQNEKTRSPSRR